MVAEILIVPCNGLPDSAKAGAQYIARSLSAINIKVRENVSLCSDSRKLQQAVAAALGRSNIIFVIGGMDSESGFLSKNIISAGLGLSLETNTDCLNAIKDYCMRTGENFLPADEELAVLPKSSRVFLPLYGKVPGCIISSNTQHIFLLPEPQQELAAMFSRYISPVLTGNEESASATHIIRTYGAKESYVREKLAELAESANPAVTTEKSGNEVLIRVSAHGSCAAMAANMCAPVLKEIARRMGDSAYGLDVDSIQAAVVGKIVKKNLSIAIAESGTNGMLSRVINETGDGQEILRFSSIADDEEEKLLALSVNPRLLKKNGAISEYTAVAMAAGARAKSGTSLGVGIAANTADFEDDKSWPGLVYIAVCDRENVYVKKLVVGDGNVIDDVIIDAAISRALNMIRLFVDYLPGRYKGCVPLNKALLAKKNVTDNDSYDENNEAYYEDVPAMGKTVKALLVAAIFIFVGCAGYFGLYYYNAHNDFAQAQALRELYINGELSDIETDPAFPAHYSSSFGALWTTNADIIGFITVGNGTDIAYPVVQSDDNTYYTQRNFYGKKSSGGIPFIDYRADIGRPSDNIAIYIHNTKNKVFDELTGYKDLSFYQKHPIISFDTLYGEEEYKVFAAFIADTPEEAAADFAWNEFINAEDAAEFYGYVDQIKSRSIISTNIDAEPEDRLITISVSTDEVPGTVLVIAARSLRPDEDPFDGVSAAALNPSPIYPDIWYSTFGGEKPQIQATGISSDSFDEDSADDDEYFDIKNNDSVTATVISSDNASEIEVSDTTAESTPDKEDDEASRLADASSKAAQEAAASSKAASEAAEQAASSKAASEAAAKAESEKTAEAERIKAEGLVLSGLVDSAKNALMDAEDAADMVVHSGLYEQAKTGLEHTWEAAERASDFAMQAEELAAELKTESAKNTAAQARLYAKEAINFFAIAENVVTKMEKQIADEKTAANKPASSSSQSQQSVSSSGATGNSAGETLTVYSNGKTISGNALDIISRIVQNEMGPSFHAEALKAQALAAYSYVHFHNRTGKTPSVYISPSADSRVIAAVSEVINQAIYYDGKTAFTPYYATSAGATATSKDVWGGAYPYLVSVDSSVDKNQAGYKYTLERSKEDVENRIYSKLGITVSGNPANWIEVLSIDDGGYNGKMAICGQTKSKSGATLTGPGLREFVFNIRSACFTVDYNAATETFTFTTYGHGHGVGLSQNGAQAYAKQGWSYSEILGHYYPGTNIG